MVASLAAVQPAAAQRPGMRVRSATQLRAEFLTYLTVNVRGVMSAWTNAWQNDRSDILYHYATGATLTVPGEATRRREEGLDGYLRSLLPVVSGLQLGMREIDGSDDFGFLFGHYTLNGVVGPNGFRRDEGYHVTVLSPEGSEWRIRSQILVSGSTGEPGLWRQGDPPELLPPFRLLEPSRRIRPLDRTRRRVLPEVGSASARFRQAWGAGDLDEARDLLTEDVVFGSPQGEVVTGRDETLALLENEDSGFGSPLFTVPVDFSAGGRMAFILERYVIERGNTSEGLISGTVMAVFRVEGSVWRIRALIFTPS